MSHIYTYEVTRPYSGSTRLYVESYVMPRDRQDTWYESIAQALCLKSFADTDDYKFRYVHTDKKDCVVLTFSMNKPDFEAVQRRVQQAQAHFTRLIDRVIEAKAMHKVVVDSIELPWKIKGA